MKIAETILKGERTMRGGKYPYVYVDGIYLRRNLGGEFEDVALFGGNRGQ